MSSIFYDRILSERQISCCTIMTGVKVVTGQGGGDARRAGEGCGNTGKGGTLRGEEGAASNIKRFVEES